jgi:glutamate/tyrosine decarboxylase-like PLP-dependent enzyme
MNDQASPLQKQLQAQIQERRIFDQARAYADAYMAEVRTREVFPGADALAALDAFDEPMPAAPARGEQILELLHAHGSPATVAQTGGRYFGFVNGGAVPAALAARWLADIWDQNPALAVMSPVVSRLEALCERWIVDLLELPAGTTAGFVGGTSTATLCGLAAGRNHQLRRLGWNVQADGLFGAPELRVILGEQAHASVFKALGLLGLGQDRVERVPVDDQGRMIASAMPALDQSCLVIAQAGNVNSGAFDPFTAICDQARKARAWVHIDGAFGLWAAASRATRPLTSGMAAADSWSVDGHKTLNAPYDCGVILCRDRQALVDAMQASAAYLIGGQGRDGMHYTPEMSRRARAVDLWATLKSLGRSGIEALIDGLCAHARHFAHLLQAQGFRILNEVVFNQVLAACATAELTQATLELIQASGECWCGSTHWNGEPVIRISVCSWATSAEDIQRAVAAFVAAREKAVSVISERTLNAPVKP